MLRRTWALLAILLFAACTAEGTPRWPLSLLFGDGEEAATALPYTATLMAQLPLVDVRSGETFTLAEFAGKTVFVEPMATW